MVFQGVDTVLLALVYQKSWRWKQLLAPGEAPGLEQQWQEHEVYGEERPYLRVTLWGESLADAASQDIEGRTWS